MWRMAIHVFETWLRKVRGCVDRGPSPARAHLEPPERDASSESASGLATVAMFMGIVSWLACHGLGGIVAIVLSKMELNKIDRGESPEAGRTAATFGFWAGVANVLVWAFIAVLAAVNVLGLGVLLSME